MEFEPGKAYFSKKLQCPVILSESDCWVKVETGYYVSYLSNDEVGEVEGPMVRLCHYESAMEAAERVLALGLDIVTQRDL